METNRNQKKSIEILYSHFHLPGGLRWWLRWWVRWWVVRGEQKLKHHVKNIMCAQVLISSQLSFLDGWVTAQANCPNCPHCPNFSKDASWIGPTILGFDSTAGWPGLNWHDSSKRYLFVSFFHYLIVGLSVCRSVGLFVCLSVSLFVCLFVHSCFFGLFVCLFVNLTAV